MSQIFAFRSLILALCLLLSTFQPGITQASEGKNEGSENLIIWRATGLSSLYIPEGDLKGQGSGDLMTKLFQEMLPEYSQQIGVTSIRRFIRDTKSGPPGAIQVFARKQVESNF